MEGNAHLLQVIRKMRSQINKLERENRALKGELQVCGQKRVVPPEREAARGGGDSNVRSPAGDGEGPAGSPASLQGSITASPALAPKEQTGTSESGLSGAVHGTRECCPCRISQPGCYVSAGGWCLHPPRYCHDRETLPPHLTSSCSFQCKVPPGWQEAFEQRVPRGARQCLATDPPAAAQLTREEEKGLEKSPSSCLSYSHSSNVKLFQEHVYRCRAKVKAVSFLLPVDMSPFAEKQGSLKSPENQSTKHLMTIAEKDM
ncbi:putative coiled-coil domain-containing protein 195 [Myiozetetes cayanensis]|uniref:putative coiled-coil domain-containing protein 195 n=1 Tax=Myiozetetes cayanensis TaxID=478635 RepID=UPI002160AF9B|nr:putative coiled-coil domain-containing protein 195 [Myiozetetes cayanensis]